MTRLLPHRNRYYYGKKRVSKFNKLTNLLGPITYDIQYIFLNLDNNNLSQIFLEYEEKYGKSASSYAKKTYNKWKINTVKLSGQTAERLIDLVPKYLTFDQRFKLVKKLCEHSIVKDRFLIVISIENPSSGINELKKCLYKDVNIPVMKRLPEGADKVMSWLNNDDVKASRILLSKIDTENSNNLTKIADAEFNKIQKTLTENEDFSGHQTINLPTATIHINFIKPKKSFTKKILSIFR